MDREIDGQTNGKPNQMTQTDEGKDGWTDRRTKFVETFEKGDDDVDDDSDDEDNDNDNDEDDFHGKGRQRQRRRVNKGFLTEKSEMARYSHQNTKTAEKKTRAVCLDPRKSMIRRKEKE